MEGQKMQQSLCLRQVKKRTNIEEVTASLPAEWESNILRLIPRAERQNRTELIESLLIDARKTYAKNTGIIEDGANVKQTTVKLYLQASECCDGSTKNTVSFNRRRFLELRKTFAEKYLLAEETVRSIVSIAQLELPPVICELDKYKAMGTIPLLELRKMFSRDVRRSTLIITNRYCKQVSKVCAARRGNSDNNPAKRKSETIKCATHVFTQQIVAMAIRSMEKVVSVIEEGENCPQIEFQLVCKHDRLTVEPSVEEVLSAYQDLLACIENVAPEDAITVDEWLRDEARVNRASQVSKSARPPEWFVKQARNRLETAVKSSFVLVELHVNDLVSQFSNVLERKAVDIESAKLSLSLEWATREKLDACEAYMARYVSYAREANALLQYVHFDLGRLEQRRAKECLQQHCLRIADRLADRIVRHHREWNENVCRRFEELQNKALNVPRDAKSLISLSEYVSRVSESQTRELRERVRRSTYLLGTLLTVTVLSDEHIELNRRTINWPRLIAPVLIKSNSLCEAMKSEIEDEMQRRITVMNEAVDELFPRLVVMNDMDDLEKIGEYVQYYTEITFRMQSIIEQVEAINEEERLFRFPETSFPKVDELKEVILPFDALIRTVHLWQRDRAVWLDGPFEFLSAQIIRDRTIRYKGQLTEMSQSFKRRIKADAAVGAGGKVFKFSGVADDPDPMQQPAPLKLCWQALRRVVEFNNYLPLIVCVCNPALTERHWKEISAIAGFNLMPNAGTTLRKIIELDLMDDFEKYEAISVGANKELDLQRRLMEMIDEWDSISFEVKAQSSSRLFTHQDKIESLLEDQLVKIDEMRSSHFVEPILPTLARLRCTILAIQQLTSQWKYAQLRNVSMNSVFSQWNSAKTWPASLEFGANLYVNVNNSLKMIRQRFTKSSTLQEIGDASTWALQELMNVSGHLDKITEAEKCYLNEKRASFGRLFFLSDAEVRKVLFPRAGKDNSENNCLICPTECFPEIKRFIPGEDRRIRGVIGKYGEAIHFRNSISTIASSDHAEEEWLARLESELALIVREYTRQRVLDDFHEKSPRDVGNCQFPSMTTIVALRVHWTCDIENCLSPTVNCDRLEAFFAQQEGLLKILINGLRNESPQLTRAERKFLSTLIILTSDHVEMAKLLRAHGPNMIDREDFIWMSQPRYYYREDDNLLTASIFDAHLKYGYEYGYYEASIIRTSLTDRCIRSVAQAYRYGLHSSIIGPSEAGKSETLKSLTRDLALLAREFDCAGESISYDEISRTFKGLVACAAWLCLLNLNRLRAETLSIVSQEIVNVSGGIRALLAGKQTISHQYRDGNETKVGNISCIIRIEHPMKHEFELPDNLRSFFRTVTLRVPDLKRIAEIELTAGGFADATLLASKLGSFYDLLSDRLPQHRSLIYDFCTRSAKAVLKAASKLKRRFPEEDESGLLLRSLIDTNCCKFQGDEDIVIFQEALHYLFPNTIMTPPNYDFLLESVEKACAKRGLHTHELFLLKIIQLYELTHVRRTVVLIGDPLVGKTEIVRCLAEALSISENSLTDKHLRRCSRTFLRSLIRLETIVSGVISDDRLLSFFDKKSMLWKDGLCAKALRIPENSQANIVKWLLVDGPLFGNWIDTLSSALDRKGDDNLSWSLPLPSGEELQVPRSTRIIFETTDTDNVSPPFLSRCGILHVDSHSINWRSYVLSYIRRNDTFREYEDTIFSLFDWALDPCLQFLYEHSINFNAIMIQQMHRVTSIFNLFDIFLQDACKSLQSSSIDYLPVWSQASLMLALTWEIGENLNPDDRQKFNEFFTSLWKGSNDKYPAPEIIKRHEVQFPSEGTLTENTYLFKGMGSWKYLGDLTKNGSVSVEPGSDELFIPTVRTIKYRELFLRHVRRKKPFLISGCTAVGKSCCMRDFLNYLPKKDYSVNKYSLYSLRGADDVRRFLLARLKRLKGRCYQDPNDKVSVNFFDDLDASTMSKSALKNRSSSSISILELIRQYFDHGHWYDLIDDMEEIVIRDVLFLASVTTSSMPGFLRPCPRFLRHFNIYTIEAPTDAEIVHIYSASLLSKFKGNQTTSTTAGVNSGDIINVSGSIANATMEIYKFALKSLLPIPSKPQYIFGLRDVARVITGCGLLHMESVETKATYLRIWVHEIWRVFADRIIDDEDKQLLFDTMKEASRSYFKEPFDNSLEHLLTIRSYEKGEAYGSMRTFSTVNKEILSNLIFTNFVESCSSSASAPTLFSSARTGKYEEVTSLEALRNSVLTSLNEHNHNLRGRKKIDTVVSHWTLEQLTRVIRILATPGGSMLILSGVGSGRRTIARLASYIQEQKMFEATAECYYNSTVWRNTLKNALRECGGRGRDAVLFLVEARVNQDCLKDVSGLLSTGDVSELFSNADERQAIIDMARLDAQGGDRNAELDSRTILDFFVRRCRRKLHCLICLGGIGQNTLGSCLTTYPSLTKNCAINWFTAWPEDALLRIATRCTAASEDLRPKVAKAFVRFYSKSNITSPLKFLHAIKLYDHLATERRTEMIAARRRYLTGLEKLETAARRVEEMKATLTVLKPQLELSAQQTVETMRKVENENLSVERATRVVKREEEIANMKAEIAGSLKAECEADLAVAIPILEDAVVALNTLKPTDITLVKAMKNPPDTVKLVMAAVCVMLSVPPDRSVDPVTGSKSIDYWGPSKRVLGDMNFLQNLREYDKDNIPTSVMQVIKRVYMTDKSFVPKIVAKASSAAEGLCKWVRAMVSYDEVAKAVAPKKEKLVAAQRECDEAEAFLAEKQRTLAALNAKLAALNDSLRDTLAKKLSLENEVADCTGKLTRAESLIASLGGEKDRWMKCVREIETSRDNVAGDTLLSCALIAFTASLRLEIRDSRLEEWAAFARELGLPCSQDYRLTNVLGNRTDVDEWHISGALSRDRFSTENAIIAKRSRLPCLFIDPQTRAYRWIMRLERSNGLINVTPTDPECAIIVKRSIANNRPVLLQNIEETQQTFLLESILALCNDASHTDNQRFFRLYVTTRLPSPPQQLADHIVDKVTIVDFTIPEEALRIRLLDIVASKERPELQEKFEQLIAQDAADLGALEQQENNILTTLSSTASDILEDESAIKALDSSKGLSMDIKKRQRAAREMTREIEMFRQAYIPFSQHSARLFATLNALALLDRMYRFSFPWFVRLYVRSIETSNRSVVLEKRLEFLSSSFRRNLYTSVSDSLRERHKLVYSFLLSTNILLSNGHIKMSDIKFFTRPTINTNSQSSSLPQPEWWSLTNKNWLEIQALCLICPIFTPLLSNKAIWRNFQLDDNSPLLSITSNLEQQPSPFQILLLSKVICPERIIVEIARLTEFVLGSNPSVNNDAGNSELSTISRAYTESSYLTPLIFILPCYSTPASLLTSFASQLGCSSKLRVLSMASGQESKAEILLRQAQANGLWLLLENCHLAHSWLVCLDKMRLTIDKDNNGHEQIDKDKTHNGGNISLEFRLWLSTQSVPGIPISLLHDSVKIVCDAPLGLKETLSRIYRSDPLRRKEFFEGCPGKDRTFSRLLYGLCVFHAIVRERVRFGAQGWSQPYRFDHSDLAWSAIQLQTLINERDRMPFDQLRYLIGECNYGGGMIDEFDRKRLMHLLSVYCNSSVVGVAAPASFPQRCEYRDVMRYIEEMPLNPSIETLRSDRNALLARNTLLANEFISDLCVVNEKTEKLSFLSSLKRVSNIVNVINAQLPKLKDCETMCNRAREKCSSNFECPLNVTLIQQADNSKFAVRKVSESLECLKFVYYGEINWMNGATLMKDVESLVVDLDNNHVPAIWRHLIDLTTTKLSIFIDALCRRVDFLRRWVEMNSMPKIVRLDDFFCCRTVLCAWRLFFAKLNNVSPNEFSLEFKVTSILSTADEVNDVRVENCQAFYVRGLHLIGGRWDIEEMSLVQNVPNVPFSIVPLVKIVGATTKLESTMNNKNYYLCPLYVGASWQFSACNRYWKNYITNIPLPISSSQDIFIECGTSLFCQID